ncbi:MAG: (2Fe-2S)-binding protein [Pseudomonadota bacterium]
MPDLVKVTLNINNTKYEIEVTPQERLIDTLRNRLHLTGTKEGCGVGECGACVVIADSLAVNSCLMLTATSQSKEIITIEGIAKDELDVIQSTFLEEGAVQCGFCIPGMILTAKALLIQNKKPTISEIEEAISGNLCRCTGYKKIVKAIDKSAKKLI